MARRAIPKIVIPGKVRTLDHKTFKVEKATGAEEDVLLHFGRAVEYKVVKLSTKGLPHTFGRKKIHWLNCFGIRDASGEYMREVHYTAFVCVPRGTAVVYYDRKGLHTAKGLLRERGKLGGKEVVGLAFETGDPGVGYH